MHLLKTAAGPETAPLAPPDRTAELAAAESLLNRIDALREGLGLPAFTPGPAEGGEIALSYAQDLLHPMETRINQLLESRQDFEQRLAAVSGLLDCVESYQSLDFPLDWIGESPFMHFAIGSLPAERLEEIRSRLAANVVLVPMPARSGHVPLVAVTTHAGGADLDGALEDVGFIPELIPSKEGATTASLSADSREEQDWLRQELEHVNESLKAEAVESGPRLADLWRQVTVERQILEAEQNFPRTEQTSLVTGWVPGPERLRRRARTQRHHRRPLRPDGDRPRRRAGRRDPGPAEALMAGAAVHRPRAACTACPRITKSSRRSSWPSPTS